MVIAIVIAATLSILIGMAVEESKFWEGKPMDDSNMIPIIVFVAGRRVGKAGSKQLRGSVLRRQTG